jgi:hypothetical protein
MALRARSISLRAQFKCGASTGLVVAGMSNAGPQPRWFLPFWSLVGIATMMDWPL